jgi:parallel beta-helix repeat protein
MKKHLLILILGLYISTTIAQTNVPAGNVSGTWTLSGSPYKIQGTIHILNDSTLTIEPGVIVDFQGPYKLNVQGKLIAIGTATDTIIFTTSIPQITIPPNPTPQEDTTHWRGIVFNNTLITNDTSKIIYCKVQFVQGTNFTPNEGGIYFNNFSNAIISKSHITNCAGLAGGFGFQGAAINCTNGSSPIISYNKISNNPSTGIRCHNTSSNPTIMYNEISNNLGTGIYCSSSNSPIIFYNTISNNSKIFMSSYGGGIYCSHSTPIISNNIISNNSATYGGGIACYDYSTPIISNNVISNNSANYGGGICFDNTNSNVNPSIYNTIIWGNTANNLGSQVFLGDEENDPDFYFCDVQGGSAAFELNGNVYTGIYQNNINADPLYVGASGGSGTGYDGTIADWSLQNNSPCIDEGNPSGTYPALDIAGNPRVIVCLIDIGAYEFQNGIPVVITLSISQPILCNGAATGEITSVVANVSSSFTYLWSNGQTTANISGLVAGSYSLTVSETTGCSFTKSISLPQPTATLVDAGIDKTVICNGIVQLEAQAKWITLNSGTTSQLRSVYFLNQDTGIVVGSQGVILKTIDGGVSWIENIHLTYNDLHSVYFTNTNTGYIVGDYGIILKTFDGGTNWITLQASGANYNLNSVYFTDANIGYASGGPNSGGSGTILKTVDGGANWLTLTSGTTNFLNSIYFTDANTGYTVGNNGTILKTTDGGTNWIPQINGTNFHLNSVYFTSADTGYIVGFNQAMLKTINGGTNWIPNNFGTGYNFHSVYFSDSNTGYACGSGNNYGAILKTSNGGTSWNEVSSGTTYVLNSIHFPTSSAGYAAGNNGTILKSSFGSSYSGTGVSSYSWVPAAELDNSTIANPITTVNSNQTYTVTITTTIGCISTDSLTVTIIPMDAIEICIVGVDSANKNMIAWNKPTSTAIDSFYIFRETNITNNYQKIGAVSYDSMSIFIDVNSYPNVQSNKYKLSIKDKCGLESNTSDSHKTMHLSINQGQGTVWNLIWDPYQGFTVSTYNIYRGTGPENMQLIGTSSGSNTQYSDLTAPTGYVYYQVEVVSPNSCNPTRSYNSSRSNIASNNVNSIFENNDEADLLSIYPNPAQDKINITSSIPDVLKQSLVSICNIQGEQIMEYQYQNTDIIKLDIKELSKGIYFIKLKTKKNIIFKKFIKQ